MDDNLPRRRLIGAFTGAWVGSIYTLFNYGINQVFVRDLPIYFDTNGFFRSLLVYSLVGAVLGLVVNIPHQAFPAVVFTSFAAGIAIFIGAIIQAIGNNDAIAFVFLLMLYSFMPLMVLIMPFIGLLRWSAGRLQHVYGPAWKHWRNWGLLTVITFLAIILGSSSLYTGESRQMLERMNSLIIRAQKTGIDKVPFEFEPVVAAIQNASPGYKLKWTDNVKDFPAEIFFEDPYASSRMQIVFAYFDSGEMIACLFRVMDAGVYFCVAP
jgi:hypothetical protein